MAVEFDPLGGTCDNCGEDSDVLYDDMCPHCLIDKKHTIRHI